MPLISR